MKKLFALVLVLAMALAIAAPALAATGWDALPTETETYDDFEMLAAKYEYYGSVAGGYAADGKYFANWDDKKGIVKDTLGRAYFEVVIPSEDDCEALYPGVDFSNLTVTIKITNVKAVEDCNVMGTPAYDIVPDATPATGSINTTKNVFTASFTMADDDLDYEDELAYMYVFAAASAADVVASITVTAGDTTLPATFLYKGVVITAAFVDAATDSYTFTTEDNDIMTFEVNSSDKIQRVFITPYVDGTDTTYQVLVDINGVISFKDGVASLQAGDTGYAAIKELYDFYMAALGFQWDGTAKYMNSKLILLNLIKGAEGSASVTFPAGYQSVVDPSVQPPQTGDATTVVGFVMIALALVAAAVVTVKKVRA